MTSDNLSAKQALALRVVKARELSMEHEISRSEIVEGSAPWDAARLRHEVRALLERSDLHVADLLAAWDGDGSGQLRKKEWLVNLKRLAVSRPASAGPPGGGSRNDNEDGVRRWHDLVRGAVEEAFDEIDCSHSGTLSRVELANWLEPPPPNAPPKARTRRRLNLGSAGSSPWSRSFGLAWMREERRLVALLDESRALRTTLATRVPGTPLAWPAVSEPVQAPTFPSPPKLSRPVWRDSERSPREIKALRALRTERARDVVQQSAAARRRAYSVSVRSHLTPPPLIRSATPAAVRPKLSESWSCVDAPPPEAWTEGTRHS